MQAYGSLPSRLCISATFMAVASESDFKAKALIDTIAKEISEVNCKCF